MRRGSHGRRTVIAPRNPVQAAPPDPVQAAPQDPVQADPQDPVQAAPMMAELLVNKARPALFARVLMRADSCQTLLFPLCRYMASLSRLFKPSQFYRTFVSFTAVDSQNREYKVQFHSGIRGWSLTGNGWKKLCLDNGFTQFDVILIFMYKHNVIEGAPITAVHRLLVVKETGHEEGLNENFCCEKCGTALLAASQL